MSRCFPYPPPGYTLCRAGEAALIESIKLQKAKEKAQRKKDKKLEKKEKKDKSKRLHKNEAKQMNEQVWADTKGKLVDDGTKVETDPLERSSLSEEHGLPVALGVPCSSSDSTENSNKRKRPLLPEDCPPASGSKIIRIRLSSKKQDEAVSSGNVCPCSTSGRATAPFTSQIKRDLDLRYKTEGTSCASAGTCGVPQHLPNRIEAESRTSTSHHQIGEADAFTAARPLLDSATRRKQKAHLKYTDLIGNWIPRALKDPPVDSDDLDWLFPFKNQTSLQSEKRQKSLSETAPCSSIGTVSSWPRADFVPEIGVYALPFTVPF